MCLGILISDVDKISLEAVCLVLCSHVWLQIPYNFQIDKCQSSFVTCGRSEVNKKEILFLDIQIKFPQTKPQIFTTLCRHIKAIVNFCKLENQEEWKTLPTRRRRPNIKTSTRFLVRNDLRLILMLLHFASFRFYNSKEKEICGDSVN
ncbi:CLUMA_CG006121, isoform A [Clunio marinus]|uniref:CLUMA_CG006121, isoform A n=1 Tax=Clunio marinus TaxID=568069 RepID=A0A1J1HX64_9DIPT|nr:CLUMA_CG006121, isoform A [Clunio marinus]